MLRSAAVGLAICALAGPGATQPLVGDGSIPCGKSYTIAAGDTLSRVAARAYGDPMLYGFIADANWDALRGNPENIAAGMSVTIPCVDASGQILTPEQAAKAASSIQAAVAAEGPLAPEQLDTLFGPVALFPDQVLTPVLVATTFPLDVMKAARFVEDGANLTDQERADQAADQVWDDSVRELAAGFPDLVTRMSGNIDWTEQAGEAVVAQTDDVLASIQRLRAKAQENGYLVDNDAQDIQTEGEKIVIAPANQNVVYVPTYDTQVVYTTPVVGAPVYHYGDDGNGDAPDWDDALVAGGIILGSAIILDEIFDDDDDWRGWDIDDDIDWDRGDITIDRGDVNIDRGDISIGGGDRTQIGGGDRISIGDSDRPRIDRGDLARRAREAGDRPRAATLPANRTPIASSASRDVARQKIEARQSAGVRPANLQASRPQAARPAAGVRQPSRQAASRPTGTGSLAATQGRATRPASVSRPAAVRTPTARAPSRSTTFQKPSSNHRASAASSRGRSSAGGRSGGGQGGGGRGGGGRGR